MRNSIRRVVAGLFASGAAAALAVSVGAAPASAAGVWVKTQKASTKYTDGAGELYYDNSTRTFYVHDTLADGAGVVAGCEFQDRNGSWWYCPNMYNGQGSGSAVPFTQSKITTGGTVKVFVCIQDDGLRYIATCRTTAVAT